MNAAVDVCRCGHLLIEHGRLLKGWPCRHVTQDGDGQWRDCPCTQFEQVGQ